MNEEKNKIIYYSNNTCVSCGKSIPEGQMVCKYCLNQEDHNGSLNSDTIDKMLKDFKSFAPEDEFYQHVIRQLELFNSKAEKIVDQHQFKRYSKTIYRLIWFIIILGILLLWMPLYINPTDNNSDLIIKLAYISVLLFSLAIVLFAFACGLQGIEYRKQANLIQNINKLNDLNYKDVMYLNNIFKDHYKIINKYRNKEKMIYEVEYQYISINERLSYKDCMNKNFINICTKKDISTNNLNNL